MTSAKKYEIQLRKHLFDKAHITIDNVSLSAADAVPKMMPLASRNTCFALDNTASGTTTLAIDDAAHMTTPLTSAGFS